MEARPIVLLIRVLFVHDARPRPREGPHRLPRVRRRRARLPLLVPGRAVRDPLPRDARGLHRPEADPARGPVRRGAPALVLARIAPGDGSLRLLLARAVPLGRET